MNNREVIDPLNLTPETSKILSAYLLRKKKHGLVIPWKVPITYGFLKKFELTCGVIAREKNPGNWHFDVISPENIDRGKFGSIHEVIAVMEFSGDEAEPLNVVAKNKRVYKIQENAAWKEFELMKLFPHMSARGLFGGAPSYISMRRFRGISLNDLLNAERKRTHLTIDQRFRLSIALLKAVKVLHDKQVCHLDIKPDNIFYDEEAGEIFILDLGISKLVNDRSDLRSRGNSVYTAPEEFTYARENRPVTKEEYEAYVSMISDTNLNSDIWSVARVIGLIWHDLDPIFSDKLDFREMIQARIKSGWRANFNLFTGVKGLANNECNHIKAQLEHMTQLKRDDRPNVETCLAVFENIYRSYQYRVNDVETVSHSNIEATFSI